MPRGWEQVQLGPLLIPAVANPALYDNTVMSLEVLRGFWGAHKDLLKTIPVQDATRYGLYEEAIAQYREQFLRALSLPGRSQLSFVALRSVVIGEENDPAEDVKDEDVLEGFQLISGVREVTKKGRGRSAVDVVEAVGEGTGGASRVGKQVKTLEDVVKMGVAIREIAGSVVGDLVEELKSLSLKDHPVLIAVDQYNSWSAPSAFSVESEFKREKDREEAEKRKLEGHVEEPEPLWKSLVESEKRTYKKAIQGKELAVPKALSFLSKNKKDNTSPSNHLANGIFVCATSFKYPEGRNEDYESCLRSLPLAVRVPAYSQREYLSAMANYATRSIIQSNLSLNQLLTFRIHTGSNPRLSRIEAMPFFFPKAVASMDKKLSHATMQNMKEFIGDLDEETKNFMMTMPYDAGEEVVAEPDTKKGSSKKRGGKAAAGKK